MDQLAQIEIITNLRHDAAGTTGYREHQDAQEPQLRHQRRPAHQLRTGRYLDYGFGGSVNHRNKLFNAYGSYDYGNGFYFESTEMQRRFPDRNFVSTFKQDNYDKGSTSTTTSAADWMSLSPKHTIGFPFVEPTIPARTTTERHRHSQCLRTSPDSGYT